MTIQVNVAEAKARFAELMRRAEEGEEVVIARGNEPVLRLVPFEHSARAGARAAVEEFLKLRTKMKPTTLEEVLSWRHEGRKY
ncbi:MAG: type II toxin-antitoxin system prevent-host-death family antitoxin [Parvularculaceae bacterium]|jgi:prevent-host-death family protein|nr:type II toxin-antitoxin system prevent-host-death family antitoxin [Parvularculaceae bacterium]